VEESTPRVTDDVVARSRAHWRENVRLIITLLAIWFTVSYVPAIFAKQLNEIVIPPGFPLGYYMGSQGSLVVFVILIFVYAFQMNKIDRKYGMAEEY
jgi:putative solute:sodium symporter small subunit